MSASEPEVRVLRMVAEKHIASVVGYDATQLAATYSCRSCGGEFSPSEHAQHVADLVKATLADKSYCGNCNRPLWGSSVDCPCRTGRGYRDLRMFDKIIALHRPNVWDEGVRVCAGCHREWPCETQQIIETWGAA